ncbi:hypothetical protein ACHAXT_003677 [Thalassiosira profunda]
MDFDYLVQQKSINLLGKNLYDGDLDVLVKVLRESKVLEELWLDHNRITLADGKLTDALAENRTLRRLDLNSNATGNEGAKRLSDALKRNDSLHVIRLGGNQIGDEGGKWLADALKCNNTLQYIDLGSNQIGGEGCKWLSDALKHNNTLEVIVLINNQIGDEGAKSLASAYVVNKALREAYLSSNNIGDVGAKSLAASLLANGSLAKIVLAENNITDEGGKSLGNAARCNRTIEYLSLDRNLISDRANALRCNHAMNNRFDDDDVEQEIKNILEDLGGALQSFMEETIEENARLKEEIANGDEELESEDKQVASLKDIIDLSGGKNEASTKRPRAEESNLATIQRKNQKIVRIKQEKEAAEANLEDVREDLDIEKETVEHQLRATDVWQRRFDEIANLAKDGPVDTAMIAEIRNRSLVGGS